MCLSLIQENVSLYSSYLIKKEEGEDTELDVIIPQKRIPNWSAKMDALLKYGDHTMISDIEDDVSIEESNMGNASENDSDSKISASESDEEEGSVSDDLSDSKDDNDDDESDYSDSDCDSDTEDSSEESDSENNDIKSQKIEVAPKHK